MFHLFLMTAHIDNCAEQKNFIDAFSICTQYYFFITEKNDQQNETWPRAMAWNYSARWCRTEMGEEILSCHHFRPKFSALSDRLVFRLFSTDNGRSVGFVCRPIGLSISVCEQSSVQTKQLDRCTGEKIRRNLQRIVPVALQTMLDVRLFIFGQRRKVDYGEYNSNLQNIGDSLLFLSKQFYITTSLALIVLAYIGAIIDNLLLTYLTCTFLTFFPGLLQHGFVHTLKEKTMACLSTYFKCIMPKTVDRKKSE